MTLCGGIRDRMAATRCRTSIDKRKRRIVVILGTGRILRPVQYLARMPGEAEYEVIKKALQIALSLMSKRAR